MTIPNKIDVMGIPYTVEEVDVVSRDGKEWGLIELNDPLKRVYRST